MGRLLLFLLAFFNLITTPKSVMAAGVSAFPGAEGFGANSVGGRGGTVYEVTNTSDSGSGSVRSCVEASGPRICVFKVGGLISLNSPLVISNPYITIAGQTAPGGGITFKLGSSDEVFLTQTHDVVIRYITSRAGPGGENHNNQMAKINSTNLYNIVIDHNSLSWGVDSNIETWYHVKDATVQWSLISEALDNSTHSKGAHSKGIMIGGYDDGSGGTGSENISLLNNVMAHNGERNPLMQMCGPAQVINNVTYNPFWTFAHQELNCSSGTSYINWINNYHKKGPSSTSDSDLKILAEGAAGKAYLKGNIGPSRTSDTQPETDWIEAPSGVVTTTPVTAPSVNSTTAQDAYNNTLAEGGAGNSQGLNCDGTWYPRRDAIDTRVINDVKNGTGHIIDDPSQVGGWITPSTGTPCADTDIDGMPDAWEQAHGLNPNSAADGNQTSSTGYTNLEDYLAGSGQGTTPTTPPTTGKTGDVNDDGIINIVDIGVIIDNYNQNPPTNTRADVDKNGIVNIVDIGVVIDNYGK